MGCPWIIQSLDTTLPSVDSQAFLPFRRRNCQGACPPMSFPAQAVCTSQVRSFASALPQVRRREASGSGRVGDSGGCQILWPEQKREEESHGCQGSVYDRNENPVLAKITELASCGMAPAPLLPSFWFPRTLSFLLESVLTAAINLACLCSQVGHYCS